ncbi:hypothetical protein [Candidatus Poriferisodalis sp.]|uniref:hypothetical protein n=1 Tax=Candidatus Poriferisodalis sp. TaxID=3101277 RepID=UPI003B02D82D
MAESHRSITEEELSARLSDEVQSLGRAGLSEDEAFLVAVGRLALSDPEVRSFAREHFAGLWDDSEPESSTEVAESEIAVASLAPDGVVPARRGRGRQDIWVMACFAVAAAVAVRVPVLFGLELGDGEDGSFYGRNLGVLVLPALAGWFAWRQRPPRWVYVVLAGVFGATTVVMNSYPFSSDRGTPVTEVLAVFHLLVLLWLVVGLAYLGKDWRSPSRRNDYVRFSGEWVVYYVLIALGGGVFLGLAAGAFIAIGFYPGTALQWAATAGAAGAVVVTAWLVEVWQGAVSRISSMLAFIFTPLFAVMLVVFLIALPASGQSIQGDREVLITFNVILGLVVGLLLFSGAARRADARLGLFDAASGVLAAAGLATNVITFIAILGRIADYGWSPNRTAIAGVNAILLVNLAGSVWLYIALWRRRRPFADIVRWQTAHFGVYAAWAAVVVVAFPPIFDFA